MDMHIYQPEKLYTVRPRSTLEGSSIGSSRGPTATMRLIGPKKDALEPNGNAAQRGYRKLLSEGGTSPFLLQGMSVAYSEKVQIHPTFGDANVAYYFGNGPVIYDFSGITIDDVDNQHFMEFLSSYAEILRGTRLAQSYTLVEITTPNQRVVGSMMNLSIRQNAQRDTEVEFSFQLLAKSVTPLEPIGSAGAVYIHDNEESIWYQDLVSDTDVFYNQTRILSIKSTSLARNAVGSFSGTAFSTNTRFYGNFNGSNWSTFQAYSPGTSGWLDTASGFMQKVDRYAGDAEEMISSIFTPVVGLLQSALDFLSDLKANILGIVSKFTKAVKGVLRTVRKYSDKIRGLLNSITGTVTGTISGIKKEIASVKTEYNRTVQSLKNTAGTITRFPDTFTQEVKKEFQRGSLDSTRFTAGSSSSSAVFKNNQLKIPVVKNDATLESGSIVPVRPSITQGLLPAVPFGRSKFRLSFSTSTTNRY